VTDGPVTTGYSLVRFPFFFSSSYDWTLKHYYCRLCAVWLALNPDQIFEDSKWEKVLCTLMKEDLTFPSDDEEVDSVDSDDGFEDKAASSMVCTQHSANGTGSNSKKWRGEGYKCIVWIWRVQMQDEHNIPGLDSSAFEEDVYKHKTKNP
jgi:hypothetical protein